MTIFNNLFENKKVLVTGNTGFKGSWLSAWLLELGAIVSGLSKDIPTTPSFYEAVNLPNDVRHYEVDIRDIEQTIKVVKEIQPEFVFHLAAQALVMKSYNNPVETYQTNIIGTLNLLEALRELDKSCTVVLITSDKCYENVEWVWGYRETDSLGGYDPYSASKGATELVIRSHVQSYFQKDSPVRIATGRAGNVIGGGDWAADRIVPDCVRSWSKGHSLQLRSPQSTRPWQHVLEPLSGYLSLAKELHNRIELHGEPFNFGPPNNLNHSVLKLVETMAKHWTKVRWEDVQDLEKQIYESKLLKLNCDKALNQLYWHATLSFEDTVRMTTEWYRSFYSDPSEIREISFSQIAEYVDLATRKGLRWTEKA